MEEWEKKWLELDEEDEDEEIRKIIESGKRKTVTNEFYFENFDPSLCRYCMNLNMNDDTCKVNSPYDYMAKDRGECEYWEYIFKSADEED